jgi:hypothetical protein
MTIFRMAYEAVNDDDTIQYIYEVLDMTEALAREGFAAGLRHRFQYCTNTEELVTYYSSKAKIEEIEIGKFREL